jgi:hypothetical protein
MYYFVTDETNVDANGSSKFFIYGGLIFSSQQLVETSKAIVEIRKEFGFKPADKLKFDTNSRPANIEISVYTEAKRKVTQACHDIGVQFIVQMVHHKIAGDLVRSEFALNTVLAPFNNKFLAEKDDYGMVIVDRLPNEAAYALLKSRFQDGLVFPDGRTVKLDRVVLYGTTCDGASHISSAVDIVLGGFRYVVNSQARPGNGTVQKSIFQNIAEMIYGHTTGSTRHIRDYGLITRPANIKVPTYRDDYDQVIEYLGSLVA